MKSGAKNPSKELYNQLRRLPPAVLWEQEVARFDRATPEERLARVAVVRAVGVVFSEAGAPDDQARVKTWLRSLLDDPEEKIRRYAMTALPKLGAAAEDEAALLALWRKTASDREKAALAETLGKIGGAATLAEISANAAGGFAKTEQKVKASVARSERPSVIRMDRPLREFADLVIHLRGRAGLEQIVRDEVEEHIRVQRKFRIRSVRQGLVEIEPVASLSLGDIYSLRCFGTLSFVLGKVENADEEASSVEMLAQVITSPLARRIFETFTEGSIRYRLDFVGKGHQRGAVRLVATRAYELCPEILNDARSAPWTVAIYPSARGSIVELSPRLSPDPRFSYRQEDVPAASHPPLAASMARVAGRQTDDVIWDPFCGSGLELIERSLRGGVRRVIGTDLSPDAIATTKRNFAAARLKNVEATFTCADFRDYGKIPALAEGGVTLVITNPPMGKRVPIPNLRGLIDDLFAAAVAVLRPGGRLVFANPLKMETRERALKRELRQMVDFGGFNCWLEVYRKPGK